MNKRETVHPNPVEPAYQAAAKEIAALHAAGTEVSDARLKAILARCMRDYGIKNANMYRLEGDDIVPLKDSASVAQLLASVRKYATTIIVAKGNVMEAAAAEADKPRDKRKTVAMDLSGKKLARPDAIAPTRKLK